MVLHPVGASPDHRAIMSSGGVVVAPNFPNITSRYGGSSVTEGVDELTECVCAFVAVKTPELPGALVLVFDPSVLPVIVCVCVAEPPVVPTVVVASARMKTPSCAE